MIVCELYEKNGQPNRIRNIRYENSLPQGYVELAAMPSGVGPWTYDGPTKLAVPAQLTNNEKLDRLSYPGRVTAALVVGALPAADTTAEEKTWARNLLLDVRDAIRAALS